MPRFKLLPHRLSESTAGAHTFYNDIVNIKFRNVAIRNNPPMILMRSPAAKRRNSINCNPGPRHMFLSTAVEACPVGPIHPRFPYFCNRASNDPTGPRIFQKPDEAAGLNNSTQLLKCRHLKLVGQRAEQERRYRAIEVADQE